MKNVLLGATLSVALLVLGFAGGRLLVPETVTQENSDHAPVAETAPSTADDSMDVAETPRLDIVQSVLFLDGEPAGHVLDFSGMMEQRVLFGNTDYPGGTVALVPLEGEEVYEQGFYFAGLDDTLFYVRGQGRLEIQRELTPEFGEPLEREVLMSITLPEDAKLTVTANQADHD